MPVNKFYEVPPIVTTFRGAELNVDTQEGLETVYKGVDAELGDTALNFDVDQRITEDLKGFLPDSCSRGECQAEVMFDGGASGRPKESQISMRCPGKSFDDETEANKFAEMVEPACKGCQRGAFLAIARWVESVPDAAEQARQELASAEDSVTSSQAALKSVFHPKV
jgi:hypothetical protein